MTSPETNTLSEPLCPPHNVRYVGNRWKAADAHAHGGVSRHRTSTATRGRLTGAVTAVTAAGCQGTNTKCWMEHRAGGCALRDLKDVQLAGVLERLAPIAEPDPHNLPVIVELLSNLSDFLSGGQWVLLEVGIESLYGLGGEGGAAFAFLGGLTSHKLHQVLLAFLVPEFGFIQPLLQHWL